MSDKTHLWQADVFIPSDTRQEGRGERLYSVGDDGYKRVSYSWGLHITRDFGDMRVSGVSWVAIAFGVHPFRQHYTRCCKAV